jgi:hypothetical protein
MKYFILFFLSLIALSVSAQQPADSVVRDRCMKAQDIYKRLMNGESFELLALKYSDSLDLQRGHTENMLGYFNSTLRTVMVKLPIGQVSEPIRYYNGYYIVRVDVAQGNYYKVHLITLKFKK